MFQGRWSSNESVYILRTRPEFPHITYWEFLRLQRTSEHAHEESSLPILPFLLQYLISLLQWFREHRRPQSYWKVDKTLMASFYPSQGSKIVMVRLLPTIAPVAWAISSILENHKASQQEEQQRIIYGTRTRDPRTTGCRLEPSASTTDQS